MIWPAEQRLTLRQERLKPLVDELETWMLTKRARLLRGGVGERSLVFFCGFTKRLRTRARASKEPTAKDP